MTHPIEAVAVVLAIAYLLLAIRQSNWCWPAAAVSATLFAWLFFAGRLYMEAVLQVFYVVMAGYGFYQWYLGGASGRAPTIQRRPWLWHLVANLVLVGLTLVVMLLLTRYTDAESVGLDTVTTVFSLFTTYLVAQKVLENWLYWIVINSLYVLLFWTGGYQLTAALFLLYVVLAGYGYWHWRQDYQKLAKQGV